MINNLSDKDKKDNLPSQEASSPLPANSGALPVTSLDRNAVGAYGQNHPLAADFYQKKEEPEHAPWTDNRKKRMAIRVFSRGVMGAAFFAGGGILSRHWMMPLKRGATWESHGYDASKKLFEQENPLRFIAKLIDTWMGKPIAWTFGENAVRFRPTYIDRPGMKKGSLLHGRSLGDEVVGVTFDFFCASVGDAWGRDIAGWFDPNVKKDWLVKDEKGRSHIQFPEAIKSALKSVTHYVTYNGGEDWFVAPAYVYFMKGQRAVLNKFNPGFGHDFDQNLNGASFKMAHNPAAGQHQITGHYHKTGILDLQTRFTVYNVGTLMFRELYDHVKHLVIRGSDHIYGAYDSPNKTVLGKAGEYAKWMARCAVKGVICMTPAVPFFWINRTPQTKHRAIFIDPEKGALTRFDKEGIHPYKPVHANELRHGDVTTGASFFHSSLDTATGHMTHRPVSGRTIKPVLQGRHFNAYDQFSHSIDNVFEGIGKLNTGLAGGIDRPATLRSNFLPTTVYASLAYTPYMIAKGETALLWDNGKMDMAAERMIDGAAKLNWGEFKAGAGEVWRTVLYKPLADPKREAEGQWRLYLDRAPVDIFSTTKAKMDAERLRLEHPHNRWQNLVAAGNPAGKLPYLTGSDGALLEDPYKIAKRGAYAEIAARPAETHAQQEDLKKVLREAEPPTSSLH